MPYQPSHEAMHLHTRRGSKAAWLVAVMPLAMLGVLHAQDMPLEPEMMGIATFFAVVGVLLALFQRGVILDRGRGVLVQWWGLGLPMSRRIRPLSDVTHLRLRRSLPSRSSNDNNRPQSVRFPLALVTPNGAVTVGAATDLVAARRRALDICRFLKVELHDSTFGDDEPRVIDPDAKQQRPARGGWSRARVVDAPPEGERPIACHWSEASLELDLPPRSFTTYEVGCFAVVLFFAVSGWAVAAVVGVTQGLSEGLGALFCLGFPSVLLVPAVPFMLKVGTRREQLRVDDHGLHVVSAWKFGETRHTIPLADVTQIEIGRPVHHDDPTHHVLCVRSEDHALEVGEGLSEAQLHWLRARVLEAIGAPADPSTET